MAALVACPLHTELPQSLAEQWQPSASQPEIRAYKLGKKRFSYNMIELRLGEAPGGDGRTAAVLRAVHADGARFAEAHQDSAVGFMIHLESGQRLQAHVYLCFDDAQTSGTAAAAATAAGGPSAASSCYAWNLVTRQHCCKNCQGRVLRSIQRFGRQGKRSAGSDQAKPAVETEAAAPGTPGKKTKDPRCMYLSLDEACTHVDASAFRLVAGIYNRQGTKLLTTAVSPPIRVLANNDVPTGAACITLEVQLPSDWEGWAAEAGEAAPSRAAIQTPRPKRAATPASRRRLALKGLPRTASLTNCQTPSPKAPLLLGLSTPSNVDVPRLYRTITAPQLASSIEQAAQDELWACGVGGSSKARQLSLPPSLPSFLPLPAAAAGCGDGGSAESGGSCGLGPSSFPAAQLWAATPAPPGVARFGGNVAAAQHEAERQLFVLQQLKAHMAGTIQPATSSCMSQSPEPTAQQGQEQQQWQQHSGYLMHQTSESRLLLGSLAELPAAACWVPSLLPQQQQLPPRQYMSGDSLLSAGTDLIDDNLGLLLMEGPLGGAQELDQLPREMLDSDAAAGVEMLTGCGCPLFDDCMI